MTRKFLCITLLCHVGPALHPPLVHPTEVRNLQLRLRSPSKRAKEDIMGGELWSEAEPGSGLGRREGGGPRVSGQAPDGQEVSSKRRGLGLSAAPASLAE